MSEIVREMSEIVREMSEIVREIVQGEGGVRLALLRVDAATRGGRGGRDVSLHPPRGRTTMLKKEGTIGNPSC